MTLPCLSVVEEEVVAYLIFFSMCACGCVDNLCSCHLAGDTGFSLW